MSDNPSTAIARRPSKLLGLDMQDLSSVASLIFNSKVYGDIQTKEAAAIKIVAGMEYGFTPFQSMSMIDFIQGRPTLNAHGKATLINSSGDFRLAIEELTAERCVINVLRRSGDEWKNVNQSVFTIEDAKAAELTTGKNAHSWKKYPRNMLFARTVSNIWRWDCAELNMRRFKPEEIEEFDVPELENDGPDVQPEQIATDAGDIVDAETGEVIHEAEPIADDISTVPPKQGKSNSTAMGGGSSSDKPSSAPPKQQKETAIDVVLNLVDKLVARKEPLADLKELYLPAGVAEFGDLTEEQAAEIRNDLVAALNAKIKAA